MPIRHRIAPLTVSLIAIAVAAGAAQAPNSTTAAASDASDHYFVMQPVKIIDQGR